MGSFALYADIKDCKRLKVDVHFNLWSYCGWKNEPPYLDVGIMIHNLEPGQRIYFYVPFLLKKEEVSDLGKAISEANLLSAVFNEKYTVEQNAGTKWVVASQNKDQKFAIFALNVDQNVKIKSGPGGKGTCLELSIPASSKFGDGKMESYPCDEVYFRFRLRTLKIKSFMRQYTGPSRFLSQFTKRVAIDFRYNDTRSFDDVELEEFTTNQKDFVQTQKVHFLLMTKTYINVDCAPAVRRRTIESGLWDSYVRSSKNKVQQRTDDIIAYHAKEEVISKQEQERTAGKQTDGRKPESVGSFEFFAKQSIETFTLWRLLWMTVLLSGISDFVWWVITTIGVDFLSRLWEG